MFKFLAKFIFSFFSNALSLIAILYFIDGVEILGGAEEFLKVVIFLTLANIFLRPIFRAALSPIILLTFGLGAIVVNVLTLYLVDFFSESIHISGLKPLFYATLIIVGVNTLISFSAHKIYK